MMLFAVAVTGFYGAGPFELAVESLPDGILIAALDGTIVFVNRGVERLFGWARADLLGQPVERLLPDALRDVHVVHRTAFARAPHARMMGPGRELIGRRRDGSTLRIEVLLSPMHTAAGQFVVASIADVTERHEHADRHEEMLAGRRAFERAAATLSNVFLTVAASRLDAVITEALEQATVALGIDRASFHQLRPDRVLEAPLEWDALGRARSSISLANSERFPWTIRECLHGQTVAFAALEQLTHTVDRTAFAHRLTQAAVVVPLLAGGRVSGVFMVESSRPLRSWTPEARNRIDLLASVLGQALSRRAHEAALARAIADADQLTRNLVDAPHQEKIEPPAAIERSHIVGESPAIRRVLEQIHQVAATDATVLLLGETGTGKSLFASYIHDLSARGRKPMVALSCAAIPDTLIESELFGRERGAFTDADTRQIGRFEMAQGSSIFLDEIGDLPSMVQVKVLRALESGEIERLGNPYPIPVDVRIIAATHRNLEELITAGTFREDLYYRLNVFPIHVPALRDRAADIPLLVRRFVNELSPSLGKRVDSISDANLDALQRYPWPGNIRELRNVVERALIAMHGSHLVIPAPRPSASPSRRSMRLEDVERAHIREVLESTGWRVRGSTGAAVRLGMKPTTLESRMVKLGIRRPKAPSTDEIADQA